MSSLALRRSIGVVESINIPSALFLLSTSRSLSSQRLLPTAGTASSARRSSNHIATRPLSHALRYHQAQPARSSLAAKPATSPASPSPSTSRNAAAAAAPAAPAAAAQPNSNGPTKTTTDNLFKSGLSDKPVELEKNGENGYLADKVDWTRSFHGISAEPFPKEVADVLLAPTEPDEVEIKPDGIIYLPEIKYRRILNRAFGPGGWGLVPRSESIVTPKTVTREYALICNGRLVSIARGEQDYFSPDGIPTATEGCKSNALVRCCKDLGIASELWDPRWIRKYKTQYTREAFVEHLVNKRKSKIWIRKDDQVVYPWKESK